MSVTITVPEDQPAATWGYASSSGVYIPLTANPGVPTTKLAKGFVLYLPYYVTSEAAIFWRTLLPIAAGPYREPPFSDAEQLSAVRPESGQLVPVPASVAHLTVGERMFIPITKDLNEQIDMRDGINALIAADTAIATSPTMAISTMTAMTTKTPDAATDNATSKTEPGPASTTATSSRTLISQPYKETNRETDLTITGAGLAGGMVGAFLAAVVLCGLIAFLCIRRRKSRQVASQTRSSESSNDYALASLARDQEKTQVVVAASSVTGWQKHLPQEKDDSSIIKLFRSIFEQVQLHMEEYYGADPQSPPDATIETLRKLAEDDLPLMLSQTGKQVLLLEGILLRCIIYRTSGRSDIKDSFLPSELIRIAKNNGWYMERTPRNSGIVSSGRKRGFPQALAQWRQLTGFLLPEHRDDQTYQSELRVKIEHAVTEIDAAFLTWACAGKSSDKRMESLRQILLQASDAGVLLFTQPSTFIFDWSVRGESDDCAATISPALVRFTEGAAKEDVLIEASQVKL